MYKSALRSAPRILTPLCQSSFTTAGRRFASTTSAAGQRRTWKSSALRWGLAVGAVYWYNTSSVFAEEPQLKTLQPPPQFSDDDLPTVEAVVAEKRKEAEARLRKTAALESKTAPEVETAALADTTPPNAPVKTDEAITQQPLEDGSPEALEEEAAQQGAFNPETGEINWDCPCLGGMAHGPCGEEFKDAFSCFVYSKEEPKGMDCIDKFQHMQDCFRLHPEVYGEELGDDDGNAGGDQVPENALARDDSEGGVEATPSPTGQSSEPATGTTQGDRSKPKDAVPPSATNP
ncbi:hypothetical protein GGS20DRAFT_561787 [Poronia punctata]|nr:hypothetical protein GGS20DRAFT_561787 [Poronia punctata]